MANKLLANPPAQSAQRTSHLAQPESKWGRHCCRPHSHPRVAFIRRTWRPVFRHFRGKPQIRFLHRRSRRHPVLSGSVSSPKTVFFPFQFRDRSFHVGQVLQAVLLLPKLQHSHVTRPVCPARFSNTFAFRSLDSLASGRNLLRGVLLDRVDSCQNVSQGQNSIRYQAVRPSIREGFSPFR